jgi:hypothetical protein
VLVLLGVIKHWDQSRLLPEVNRPAEISPEKAFKYLNLREDFSQNKNEDRPESNDGF